MALPSGSMFPTSHTIALIERARASDPFLYVTLFDGATEDGAARVNAVIGRETGPAAGGVSDLVAGVRGWRMRLAFFDFLGEAPEPHYELGVELLENGVARGLQMDYGDFVIDAVLDRIEPLAKPAC